VVARSAPFQQREAISCQLPLSRLEFVRYISYFEKELENHGWNIVMLTDGLGGFGDIAKFDRDFMQALDASLAVARV
jgi:hypothetical protein